ncbi:PREDICTED: maltose excess protein 1, chloroplastic-like isoform X1 [Tarenaya hassleriana]|uniref:maltose excess protein 1, chloroplastic-like isoform X1 n=1 Tax=Tarenaya hassleriana TaxID=28532 RepID=UPI00053C77DA|nr:PREDICTED: maltose excess protein 1, chloroplastic-like isoform X1 [Tarenaya hassleriana]
MSSTCHLGVRSLSPSTSTVTNRVHSVFFACSRNITPSMAAKSVATPLSDHRFLIFPNCPRSSRFPTRWLSCSSSKRDGGPASVAAVDCSRGLGLTRCNSVLSTRRRLVPARAIDSDFPHPLGLASEDFGKSKAYEEWDSWTAKFSGAANLPFLMLQLPQIILNAQNLMAGNKAALFAVPWLGMLTGLLGNLSLLSYFAKKKEKEAVLVQTLGIITTYIVLSQLRMAEAMPLPHFVATSTVVTMGLILNFMNYFGMLNATIWQLWEDFITIGGVSVLPQIMWSTFIPYVPNSIVPGAMAFVIAVAAVTMARIGKLSEKGVRFVGSISGWTATLLFMWMPISQMWTNFLNPDNIKGLSPYTMVLAMMGNGLLVPRALFIRDLMWFTGSAWSTLFYGYGNILCLYIFNCASKAFFVAATISLVSWIGLTLWGDAVAYGHKSPFRSMKELVWGS